MWFRRRTPSDLEQGLYREIGRVFPDEILSFEHRHVGDKKSVDVYLMGRRIAFQADGKQHAKMVLSDRQYDKKWLSRGVSVVRLSCIDSAWNLLIEKAREESAKGHTFYILSPSYRD
jgi:very-short-patch-repair endonuclease